MPRKKKTEEEAPKKSKLEVGKEKAAALKAKATNGSSGKTSAKKGKSTSKTSKSTTKKSKVTALSKVRASIKKSGSKALDHFVPITWDSINKPKEALSTGNVKLDYLFGGAYLDRLGGNNVCPGAPRGMITNIYGAEHSGKTSLALHIAAEVNRQGGTVLYIDYENVLDSRYARKLGCLTDDEDMFALYQPETLEQGVAALGIAATNGVDLIVFDSVGAAEPRLVFELGLENANSEDKKKLQLGLQAATWSKYLSTITRYIKAAPAKGKKQPARPGCALLAIAQTRSTIGGTSSSDKPQGGKAWRFYSALRVELKYIGSIKGNRLDQMSGKKKEAKISSKIKVIIRKSKVSPTTHWEDVLECVPNYGFDAVRCLVDVASAHGVITRSGSWYEWERRSGEVIRGQGKPKFLSILRKIDGVQEELESFVRPLLRAQDIDEDMVEEEEDYDDYSDEVEDYVKPLTVEDGERLAAGLD